MPAVPAPARLQAVGPGCRSGIAITAALTPGTLLDGRRWVHRTASLLTLKRAGPLLFWPGGAHGQFDSSSILAPGRTRSLPFWPWGAHAQILCPCVPPGYYVSAVGATGPELSGRGCRKASTLLLGGHRLALRQAVPRWGVARARNPAAPVGSRQHPSLRAGCVVIRPIYDQLPGFDFDLDSIEVTTLKRSAGVRGLTRNLPEEVPGNPPGARAAHA